MDGQGRVAAVAEDVLHEVEVADQGAGDEETRLHAARRGEARDGGHDDGAQVEGDEAPGGRGLPGGEGQGEQVGRRVEGAGEQGGEDVGRDGLLVVGDWQAALGDVEDALGGAAVGLRVVEDAVVQAGGGEDGALVLVGAGREREGAGEAGAVEDEGGGGQVGHVAVLLERVVEVVLDALIDGAEVLGKDAVLFAAEGDEVVHQLGEGGRVVGGLLGGGGQGDGGLAELAQLEIQVGQEARVARIGDTRQQGGGVVGFVVHGGGGGSRACGGAERGGGGEGDARERGAS